jgi:CRP-like cAMP-binding protein
VFGELSVLLDQPHAADVRALEALQFYIVDAATLRVGPIAVLYIATVLARRLDDADQALVALRRELQAGEPRGAIEKAAETMEGLLGAGSAGPEHARYPYDLFAPRRSRRFGTSPEQPASRLKNRKNCRRLWTTRPVHRPVAHGVPECARLGSLSS